MQDFNLVKVPCKSGNKPKLANCLSIAPKYKTIILVMKLTTIILLIACLQVSAGGFSQTVTFSGKDVPLEKVFAAIEQQTGYVFFYTADILKDAKPVTLNVKNASVQEVLRLCLKKLPLDFIIENKTIVIAKKKESEIYNPLADLTRASIEVRGLVTDENGAPLQGVNVTVKDSHKANSTNIKGEFALNNVDENAVLIISSMGYETQEIPVGNRTFITIRLNISISKLDEVQIIAYGQTTQRLSTGNVNTVKATDIQKQPVNNPLLALQARVPGVVITQNTGVPGGGITIRVQGQNSLNRGTDPLYVIDGVPYTSQLLPNINGSSGILGQNGNNAPSYVGGGGGNPLSFINPADIESIDILKDADATAIYGSQAGNGAVLITTKKGKPGKTQVNLNVQTGWGKVTRMLDLLNTRQYLDMRYEAFKNDGVTQTISNAPDLLLWDTTRYTDWQKELIGRTAHYTDAQASVSGGTVNTNFLVSAGYHRETTVFPGDLKDRKGSLHFNLDHKSANQKFRLQLMGNYLIDDNQLIGTDLTATAINLAPIAPPLYNTDGTLNWASLPNGNSSWYNPLAYLVEKKYGLKTNNLISNSLISYQLLPGLDIKSSFGYTNLQINETQVYPLSSEAPENRPFSSRFAVYANNNINSWIIEPQITYKRSIGKLRLDGLAGATFRQTNSKGQQLYGFDYPNDEVLEDINSAALIGLYWPTVNAVYKYNAVFGRLNLNWQDKYIINLTARRDGSSRFGPENQFQNFGSVAGAWIFSNETFIQKKLPFVSFGKLRASYGTSGNDQIGDYQFMNLYGPYNVAVPYQGAPAIQPTGLPNPYLEWEETKKLQLGLDLGFFKDRVVLNVNYYRNRSSNQLQPYALPLITGRGNIQTNFPAEIQNTGWEFSINTTNVSNKEFTWRSIINLTTPKNKLTEFPDLEKSSFAGSYVIGHPVTIARVFHFSGVDPATGLYQFIDKNGNLTSTPNFSTDRTVVINTDPEFYGGFQNSFTYKGLQLDLLFQFVKQTGRNYFFGDLPGRFRSSDIVIANQPIFVLDRWQKPSDNTSHQQFSATYPSTVRTPFNNAAISSGFYSDASFIRLKNLSFSWQLPGKWKQAAHLQNARIYVQGQNLLTITDYEGIDPENRSVTSLPPLRVLTVGVQVGL